MLKIGIAAAVALVVGIVLGFFLGRSAAERQWSQPYAQVSPAEEQKSASAKDADPTPKAGTKILKPMPIGRARMALAQFTGKDPVLAPVAAFGSGDKGLELHVVVENKGTCTLKEVSGVAYGFDAYGRPTKANAAGESYVAFTHKGEIAPGAKDTAAALVKNAELATLALAHVDHTTCTDGSTWSRP